MPDDRPIAISATIVLLVIAFISLPLWTSFLAQVPGANCSESLETSSKLGDTYGIFNALVTTLAFGGLIISIYYQRQDLRAQTQQLAAQEAALKSQKFEMEASNFQMSLDSDIRLFFNLTGKLDEILQWKLYAGGTSYITFANAILSDKNPKYTQEFDFLRKNYRAVYFKAENISGRLANRYRERAYQEILKDNYLLAFVANALKRRNQTE